MATKKKADALPANTASSEKSVEIPIKKTAVKKAAVKGEKKVKAASPKKATATNAEPTASKPKKAVTTKVSTPKSAKNTITVTFEVRFSTEFGQQLFIVGNHELLGNNDIAKATPLQYLNEKAWNVTLDFDASNIPIFISYKYFVQNIDGSIIEEGVANKNIDLSASAGKNIYVSDFWSFSGFPAGLFETKPFKVLLNKNTEVKKVSNATHIFTIKAPVVNEDEVVCMLGNDKKTGAWEVKKALPLSPLANGNWQIELDLSKSVFPLEYKFGLWNKNDKKLITLEGYENRICNISATKDKKVFINEGLINLPENA